MPITRNITSAMDCNGGTTTGSGMQYRYTYYDNGWLGKNRQAAGCCSPTLTTFPVTSRKARSDQEGMT
ncbi:MAG: hypothetical protein K1W41_23735 [Lachnospiraceae bacterium]